VIHGDRSGDEAKRSAGHAALQEVASGMRIGLGTGSTVTHFLEALGAALGSGKLTRIQGVPTSHATAVRARELGIPLMELHEAAPLDLAVDGADEVDPGLDLIKGLGGALLREKMVVQEARRFVVIADPGKEVDRLGTRAPLPVELVSFGWRSHLPFFRSLGAEPRLRTRGDEPFLTDNGNLVVDLIFAEGIPDPEEVELELGRRAGVVETGLFLGVASLVVVGTPDGGARRRERKP
jgi:ribose 5-phosphate isomerase A